MALNVPGNQTYVRYNNHQTDTHTVCNTHTNRQQRFSKRQSLKHHSVYTIGQSKVWIKLHCAKFISRSHCLVFVFWLWSCNGAEKPRNAEDLSLLNYSKECTVYAVWNSRTLKRKNVDQGVVRLNFDSLLSSQNSELSDTLIYDQTAVKLTTFTSASAALWFSANSQILAC